MVLAGGLPVPRCRAIPGHGKKKETSLPGGGLGSTGCLTQRWGAGAAKEPIMWYRRILSGGFALFLIGQGTTQAATLSPQQVYAEASPAVVMVLGYGGAGRTGNGGTGLILRGDGLVLTNAHVVVDEQSGKPFPKISVYLKPDRVTGNRQSDLRRAYQATLLAHDNPLDLALLKLDGPPADLPTLELSDSARVRIGDRVLAIGHPEQGGLWALTTGVVSAVFDDFNKVKGKHVFQTEVGLNRGNSGGPLLDLNGQVVGINTAIARLAPDGMPITSISFSLTSNVARTWLADRGVRAKYAAITSDQPAPPRQPKAPATPPSKPAPTIQSPPKPTPYNLDELIRERSREEAEMEQMMDEMRGSLREKSKRR